MVKPVRLQRSRAAGSRLVSPNGLPVRYCGRPGKWRNPFKVGDPNPFLLTKGDGGDLVHPPIASHAEAFNIYAKCALSPFPVPLHILRAWGDAGGNTAILIAMCGRCEPVLADLHDVNLLCWCTLCPRHAKGKPLDEECTACQSCHVDILARLLAPPPSAATAATAEVAPC